MFELVGKQKHGVQAVDVRGPRTRGRGGIAEKPVRQNAKFMEGRIVFTPAQSVALTLVLLLACAASFGMAFNVDAIVLSFRVTNFQAGLVASTEMGTIAAGNLLLARLAPRLNARRVYFLGTLAIVLFNLLSLFAGSVWELLMLRAPVGFALGAVVSTVMATAARSATPELTFGVINSFVGVMGFGLAFLLPRALHAHLLANEWSPGFPAWNELDGLYAVYLLCSLLALTFIRGTPVLKPLPAPDPNARAPSKGIGWLALFGLGLIFFGHSSLALFLVRVGREVLLDAETIGYVLMVSALVGIVCPLLAGYIGSRSAPGLPVLVIISILFATGLALSGTGSALVFFLATPLFAPLPTALMPIMLGVLSRFDPTGTLAGAHAAFLLIGGALAPFAGGAISDATGGFAANGWFAAGCFVVGALLCWPVIARARR